MCSLNPVNTRKHLEVNMGYDEPTSDDLEEMACYFASLDEEQFQQELDALAVRATETATRAQEVIARADALLKK